jgi:hypothetical protein
LDLVNRFRRSNSSPAFSHSKVLPDVVCPHTLAALAGKVSLGHHGLHERAAKVPYSRGTGENIASTDGYEDPLYTMVDGQISSRGHDTNLPEHFNRTKPRLSTAGTSNPAPRSSATAKVTVQQRRSHMRKRCGDVLAIVQINRTLGSDAQPSVRRSGGDAENQTENGIVCADTEAAKRARGKIKWRRGRAWDEVERELKPIEGRDRERDETRRTM